MPTLPASPHSTAAPTAGGNLRLAFFLVTSLVFLWGFSYGLLDVLNKHFQEALHVTRARSGFLQMAYFGAYFLMAMPAAWLIFVGALAAGAVFMLVGELLPWPVAVVAALVTLAAMIVFVLRWSGRPGWGPWHRLALAAGALRKA